MNLSEALAALKDKEGYIYILTLPEVPEIIKIVGSKAPKSEVEAEFLPFVIASSHKVDFYEKSTKWQTCLNHAALSVMVTLRHP